MIEHGLPWLLSAITIYMTVLAGNKAPHAWAIGLGNQALWLFWIVSTASWGFLPMNLALWIVYGRNHFKWNGTPEWVRGAAGKARELALGVAPARPQRQASLAPTPTPNDAMGDLMGDPASKPIEVSPTPPKNPIRAGQALKNILAFFGGLLAWMAKNPMLAAGLVLVAAFLLLGPPSCSPFGKSRGELRLEREIAEMRAEVEAHRARMGELARDLAVNTERDRTRRTQVIAQAQQEIEHAAAEVDPSALSDAYESRYLCVLDPSTCAGGADPAPSRSPSVRGARTDPA